MGAPGPAVSRHSITQPGGGSTRAAIQVDDPALVRADPDGALTFPNLDVESELALIDDLPQPRGDGAPRPFHRTGHVLDADLEPHRPPPSCEHGGAEQRR